MPNDPFYSSSEWLVIRRKALVMGNYQCVECGVSIRGVKYGGAKPVIDHIIPRRKRPDLALELSNLQCLCIACHNRKTFSIKYKQPKTGIDGFPVGSEWS